jgi:hypothetical protein
MCNTEDGNERESVMRKTKPYTLEQRVEKEFERLGGIIQCSTPWTKNDLIHGQRADFIIMDDINGPPLPTRFWECEYCGTVNPINVLDCRAKACGHSITRKAMEAAFGEEKPVITKVVEHKEDKWKTVNDWEQYNNGDILIGSNSSSSSNINWTTSNYKMTFRNGTTVAHIGTDGKIDFGA